MLANANCPTHAPAPRSRPLPGCDAGERLSRPRRPFIIWQRIQMRREGVVVGGPIRQRCLQS